MSVGSIVVVVLLFALVGFSIWRGIKKGVPCSCGCSCGECGCGCGKERQGDENAKPRCGCGEDMV